MLITTIDQFVEIIPTAEGSEFSALAPYLNDAEQSVINYLTGKALFDYIAAKEDTGVLKSLLLSIIAYEAYENAIPFVDLIQTTNGFAVVKNNNQAPASKERVDRLLKSCSVRNFGLQDLLIKIVSHDSAALAEWQKFDNFEDLTDCLFFTGEDFGRFATLSGVKRNDFLQAKPDLISWQTNILEPVVSADFMRELIDQLRTNSVADDNLKIIHECRKVLGQLYNKNEDRALQLLNNLSNILDKGIETYTTYAGSDEYALKTSAKYENKQSDPTFFFGM